MNIATIGIDLAKSVFAVHVVDERGKNVFKKTLKREQVASFFANPPAFLIGMEACGGAHHWARKLQGMGHTVRLVAPQFVKPYVKTNKNDAADAEATCEAVARRKHALRADQERRTAICAVTASCPAKLCWRAYRTGEPDSRSAQGVRADRATRHLV